MVLCALKSSLGFLCLGIVPFSLNTGGLVEGAFGTLALCLWGTAGGAGAGCSGPGFQHPQALTPEAYSSGKRGPRGGPAWLPAVQAFDLGAPAAGCLTRPVTDSHTLSRPATWRLLCVPFQTWGRGAGNTTECFLGELQRYAFSNQKEFPSFPLMFCLCVV